MGVCKVMYGLDLLTKHYTVHSLMLHSGKKVVK
jgi:hypothetical protein